MAFTTLQLLLLLHWAIYFCIRAPCICLLNQGIYSRPLPNATGICRLHYQAPKLNAVGGDTLLFGFRL